MKRQLRTKVLPVLGRVVAGVLVLAALAVAVLTFGELLDSNPPQRTTTTASARSEPRIVRSDPDRGAERVDKPTPPPRLHGAKPTFGAQPESGKAVKRSRAADPAAAEQADLDPPAPSSSSPSSSSSASAAAAKISSSPQGSAVGKGAAVAGDTASAAVPTPLEVANEFAQGFVAYETGAERGEFEDVFRSAATPELRKALLERPPKQPAGAKVPPAKVLNVVAGPSRSGVQRASVSLLRVGVTSELRLDLKKVGTGKDAEWRVANVLG